MKLINKKALLVSPSASKNHCASIKKEWKHYERVNSDNRHQNPAFSEICDLYISPNLNHYIGEKY